MQDSLEARTLGVNIQQQLGVVQRGPLNKYMSLNNMGGRVVSGSQITWEWSPMINIWSLRNKMVLRIYYAQQGISSAFCLLLLFILILIVINLLSSLINTLYVFLNLVFIIEQVHLILSNLHSSLS